MCNVTVPVLSSNIQSSLTWEAVCVALIITCFGSLSPKYNVPESLTFCSVVIVESCLIVTSVAGSLLFAGWVGLLAQVWVELCTQKGHQNLNTDMRLIAG